MQTLFSSFAQIVTREHDLNDRQPAHLQDEAFLHRECDVGTQSPAMCVSQWGNFSAFLVFLSGFSPDVTVDTPVQDSLFCM